MLANYQASLDDRKKFTALVKDLFPDQSKNVNLLLMAYNMGIAQDIQSVSHINNTFAFRYVKQLMDDFGMSRVNADSVAAGVNESEIILQKLLGHATLKMPMDLYVHVTDDYRKEEIQKLGETFDRIAITDDDVDEKYQKSIA